jgi:hypothetical protein
MDLDAAEIRSTMASARKSAWKKQAFAEEMRARTVGAVQAGCEE